MASKSKKADFAVVTHDPKIKAIYISIQDEGTKVAKTKELDTPIIVDYDEKGKVIGIEILGLKL